LAIAHGLVAVSGFGLMVYDWSTVGLPGYAKVATVIFGLGAIGGATLLFGFHLRGRALPLGAMIAHGLVAAAALSTLLIGLAFGPPHAVPPVPTPATLEAPADDTHKPSEP